MLSDRKISNGGVIGALVGIVLSFFSHKNSDSRSKKVVKTGTFGLAGFLLGTLAEKKYKNRK